MAAPRPLSSVPVLERLPSVGECGVGDVCSLAPVLAAAWRRAGAFRRGAALPGPMIAVVIAVVIAA